MKKMSFFSVIPFLAIMVFMVSCQKEEPQSATEVSTEDQALLRSIEDTIAAADRELEYDYENPAMPQDDNIGFRSTVYLPAGSNDGLADAIAQAGVNGKVVVKSGNHYESGTVLITNSVRLEGENGARILFDNSPSINGGNIVVKPAIHVKNCNFTKIKNLIIEPQGEIGSNAIFLENARFTRIEKNEIKNFVNSVWLSDRSERGSIYDNEVTYDVAGSSGNWGMTIESGSAVNIKGNQTSGYAVGIFISDRNGKVKENELTNCTIGILACTVQGTFELPDGNALQNAKPCENYKVMYNEAYNNYWNYLIIDGAIKNFYYRNQAWNPGLYDLELAGPTSRFGAPSPTSANNFVVNYSNNIVTKDCGVDNVVLGGSMISNNADTCF